jgi:hypothetical protein
MAGASGHEGKFLVLLESTVIKFFGVNVEIKSFSEGKVNLWMRSVSYSKMNTLLFFCVFTFRVDRNVFFVENEKYVCPREDEQFVGYSR